MRSRRPTGLLARKCLADWIAHHVRERSDLEFELLPELRSRRITARSSTRCDLGCCHSVQSLCRLHRDFKRTTSIVPQYAPNRCNTRVKIICREASLSGGLETARSSSDELPMILAENQRRGSQQHSHRIRNSSIPGCMKESQVSAKSSSQGLPGK